MFHVPQQSMDSGAGFRKALGQRASGSGEIVRHQERLLEWAAAHLIEYVGRNPFDRVDDAGAGQRVVFRVTRIMRIAGLVQRAFDEQIAGFVARCRAAHRIAAFDDQDLAAFARQDRAGGQASEAGADHHYVIARH